MASRELASRNIDISVLNEKRLDGIYTRHSEGYDIVATTTSWRQGGVALLYKPSKEWNIEGIKWYGSNVISFRITSGKFRWRVVGMYFPHGHNEEVIQECNNILQLVEKAVENKWKRVILLGDLNSRLKGYRNRDIGVSTRLESWGTNINVADHFKLAHKYRIKATWRGPGGKVWRQ